VVKGLCGADSLSAGPPSPLPPHAKTVSVAVIALDRPWRGSVTAHGFEAGCREVHTLPRRQPTGGLSHAKARRDVRCCHPGGDDARHHCYRDGIFAQPNGVGEAIDGRTLPAGCCRCISGLARSASRLPCVDQRNGRTSSNEPPCGSLGLPALGRPVIGGLGPRASVSPAWRTFDDRGPHNLDSVCCRAKTAIGRVIRAAGSEMSKYAIKQRPQATNRAREANSNHVAPVCIGSPPMLNMGALPHYGKGVAAIA
jgi:hypothetical protein